VPALGAIALQALVVSVVGQWIGYRLGAALGERAEVAAGVVLCLRGLAVGLGRLAGLSGM
jgi:putative Mn2+ efflux pump MntP